MAVRSLHKRKMISRRKKKSPAQRMLELMAKHGATQKQIRHTLALSTFGGGTLSPADEALFNLPPLKTKTIRPNIIPITSQIAKTTKNTIRLQRKRAIAGAKAVQAGALPPSSWIRSLEYRATDADVGNVWADFNGRRYTFQNVPETLFNAWYAGAAATRTADKTKARRWALHDFPSLGAFYDQRIKDKFKWSKGWL